MGLAAGDVRWRQRALRAVVTFGRRAPAAQGNAGRLRSGEHTSGASRTGGNLTLPPERPRMRGMRPNWRRVLPWAALGAVALFAFGAGPHLHDEVEEQGECCVLCHAQEAPSTAAGLPANPDPAVLTAVVPVAVAHAHGIAPTGGGSRAPPA